MLCKGRAVLAAAAVAALLSGCGGSGGDAGAKPAAPASPADARTTLAKAVSLLRADGTGAFDAVTTSIAGGFLQTRQVGGSFDLARDAWAGTIDLQVSAVGNPNVGGYEAKLAGHQKALFVNVGKGAKAIKGANSVKNVRAAELDAGQWYRAGTGGLPLAASDLSGLSFLGRVKALEIRPSGGGGQVVTGTLSAADAVDLLGLAQEVRRLDVKPAALAGTAVVTVSLDEAGRPVRMRLSGDDVTFTGKAPRELRDLVAQATYAQSFHSLGNPVKIALPKVATPAAGTLAAAARNVL